MSKNKNVLKSILRIIFIGVSIGSLYFVPWILVKAWILPLPNSIEAQLDEAIGHGFDGMIVYVDEAGKAPVFYSAGWHNKAKQIPAYPQALFKIASISKLYTAVAATKLVHENRLSFDKTLTDYLPELSGRIENAEEITLRMMIQHRSGIPNFTANPAYWENEEANSQNALAFALDLPAEFKPNQGYGYSNTNYLLLRRILDDVIGYSHNQYIKEEILIPLALKNTYFSITEVDLDKVMSGYYVGYEEDFKAREYGMLATAEDVGIFLRALNNGSVFDQGEKEIYPYEYNHGGLVVGYQSLAEYHKDIDAVVVQFNNTTDFNGYEWNLGEISISRIIKIIQKKKSNE
ncbi:beta-lactamase family protein [Flavobacteriaceae bacterium]|nr:beta-lactamase family protein [Flavobacteriaceae bacterium]